VVVTCEEGEKNKGTITKVFQCKDGWQLDILYEDGGKDIAFEYDGDDDRMRIL
jgi:hypothetical protein